MWPRVHVHHRAPHSAITTLARAAHASKFTLRVSVRGEAPVAAHVEEVAVCIVDVNDHLRLDGRDAIGRTRPLRVHLPKPELGANTRAHALRATTDGWQNAHGGALRSPARCKGCRQSAC